MADLFAFGSAVKSLDAEDRYGSTGDLKKTQYIMQLLGTPDDADTLKALIIAAEKGIEIETAVLDEQTQQSDSYRQISPLGVTPALKEAHYQVCGDLAIISFIEGRGLGNRMPPRNAAILAEQNYWIEIARSEVAPAVETIVSHALGEHDDAAAVASARQALETPLEALDRQLNSKEFIVGAYSYADVHWTAYIHLLCVCGEANQVEQRPHLAKWWQRIQQHKSFSGQDLVAYKLLPTLDDLKEQHLNDVLISDF